jgi:hypothetical protein
VSAAQVLLHAADAVSNADIAMLACAVPKRRHRG